jgi:hypothetical protein
MFFRRKSPKTPTFEERLESLRGSGFRTDVRPDGRLQVSRDACAATIKDAPDGGPRIQRVGRLSGDEIALLVDAGYQKFWQTCDGRRIPALARQLQELHEFQEDLREALGLVSLYHTALGTTNDLHLYDRVRST